LMRWTGEPNQDRSPIFLVYEIGLTPIPRKNGIQNDSFKGVQKITIDLIIGLLVSLCNPYISHPKIRSLLALTYLLQSSIACYWLPVIAINIIYI
jgi:hypothetical protein